MSKQRNTAIAVTAIAAVAICAAAYLTEKPAEPNVDAGTNISEPAQSGAKPSASGQQTKPETPTPKPEAPVVQSHLNHQPAQTGEEPVVVYVPDEQAETLTPVGTAAADDSDQALVDALIQAGVLPEGVEVLSASETDGVLTLDMNAAFSDAIRNSGSSGETMMIYSVVNTFIQARSVEQVLITVEGKTLQSGHEVYDYPMTKKEDIPE